METRQPSAAPPREPATPGVGAAAGALAIGTCLGGRYDIVRELGRGGMATVYLADDRVAGARVALKMMRPDLTDGISLARFRREIDVIARLRHPHIVPLLDSGAHEGRLFYVMPVVAGETLRDWIERERQLRVDDVVRIGTQIASALAHAHAAGIVHRDITPANILIDGSDARLLDFGIGRVVDEATAGRLTSSGFVLGTPAYMSPEQASGGVCDARSDMYSLACVLYEALAGVAPFVGPTPQAVIARRFGTPPAPLAELRTTVTPALSAVVARAMALAPADRHADLAEFGALMAAGSDAMPGATSSPRTAPAAPSRRRWSATARWTLSGAAVAAVAAALAVAASAPRLPWSRHGLEAAHEAIAAGRWTAADTMLRALVARGDRAPSAHLWLAQVGALVEATAGDPLGDWKSEVALARDGRAALTAVERERLEALSALARGAHDSARVAYERLLARRPDDVVTRLAVADAIWRDSIAVRDARTPSGWRFRGSAAAAERALLVAFELRPREPAIRRAAYDRLRRVLGTTSASYRMGVGAGEGAPRVMLAGFRVIAGDSLDTVPFPIAELTSPRAVAATATMPDALDRGRRTLLREAASWVRDIPDDPHAHAAYSLALGWAQRLRAESPDDTTAITALREARRLTAPADERFLLAAREVQLLVASAELERARALADSLLRAGPASTPRVVHAAQFLNGVLGRAGEARRVEQRQAADWRLRLADGRPWRAPPALAASALALWTHAAFGGPLDSIDALRTRIDREVAAEVPPTLANDVRRTILMRASSLTASAGGGAALLAFPAGGDRVVRMQQAVARRDLRAARAELAALDSLRRGRAMSAVSLDVALLTSEVRLAVGDTSAAELQMDAVLRPLRAFTDQEAVSLLDATAYVRLLRLRAGVAAARGDSASAWRWNAAVDTLWRDAEPALRRRPLTR